MKDIIEGEAEDFLSRDEILAVDDMKVEIVRVPEWGPGKDGKGMKVRIRTLPSTERDAFESSLIIGSGKHQRMSVLDIRAKLVALSIVDAQGNLMFSLEDAPLLGRKSAAAMDRLFGVSQRMSKMSDEDVEELVKNSNADRSADSSFS